MHFQSSPFWSLMTIWLKLIDDFQYGFKFRDTWEAPRENVHLHIFNNKHGTSLYFSILRSANKCEGAIQVYVMHMTGVNTQENKKGQEATHKSVWPVITTGLTNLAPCTHHTGLTGVENRFADLVSNNTSTGKTCLSNHKDTIQYYKYNKA
jgi:hypothetical protein